MQAATAMIDDRQRRRIYGAARGIGMTNDDLHALATDVADKDSLKELTAREADALIRELQRRHPSAPLPPSTARQSSTRSIREGRRRSSSARYGAMMYDIKAMDTEPCALSLGERLSGIIRKELHVSATAKDPFAWLTYEQCSKLIDIIDKGYVPNIYRARKRGKGGGSGGG